MKIKGSIENGKDKVVSRCSDDSIIVVVSMEISPRVYKEISLLVQTAVDAQYYVELVDGHEFGCRVPLYEDLI